MFDMESLHDSVDVDIGLMLGAEDPDPPRASAKNKAKAKAKGRARPAGNESGDDDVPPPPAPPSLSGSSEQLRRGTKRKVPGGDRGFRICKGCGEKIKCEDCALNFPGCRPCKRALDNIARLASKQGAKAVAFVKEQRDDPEKCKDMVANYKESCPECMNELGSNTRGKKRGQWNLTKYQEKIVSSSGILRDKVGELMPQKVYLEFAATARGGRKSDVDALSQWRTWELEAEAKTLKRLHDFKGDGGALRVWIHTMDEVRFRSGMMNEKEIIHEGESLKKASQADEERLRSKMLQNHEALQDNEDVVKALMANGETAFQGNDGFLIDVFELCSEHESKKPDEQGTESAAADKSSSQAAGGGDGERPNKRAKVDVWVERDRVISAVVRSSTQQIKVFTSKAEASLKKHEEALSEIQEKAESDPVFKKNFEGELKILENRVHALQLVVANDLVQLQEYIGRFSCAPSVAAAGEEKESMKDAAPVELGKSPPSTSYASLRPVQELLQHVEKYHNCTQPAHVKEVTASITTLRAPIAELLSLTARAEKFLKSAIESLKKQEQKKLAEARKPKKVENPTVALFDTGAEKAESIPRRSPDEVLQQRDLARPFILRLDEAVSHAMKELSGTRVQIDQFQESFDQARAKQKGIRMSKAMEMGGDQSRAELMNKVAEIFKSTQGMVPRKTMSTSLLKYMDMSIFGVDVNYDKVSAEGLSVATGRLCLRGTRAVVMTEMLQLQGFMTRKGIGGVMSVQRMSVFLRSMNAQLLNEYASVCTLWAATVADGDFLYTPYGFVQGELVTQATIGIR
ncbi:unnamed protein product, partial [Symbiodinium sp. CCMP2592]